MSLSSLPEQLLERWFAEFEFLPGMRDLAASGPFAVTTQELLALEGPETTALYLALGLDYVENPGNERLRRPLLISILLLRLVISALRREQLRPSCC